MANPLELIDKSSLINNKITEIVTGIKRDILNGTLKSKTQAFVRLRDEVNTFIKSLVEPTMEVRKAYNMPVSQDINDMLHEILNDLNFLQTSSDTTLKILDASFNKISIERDMLYNTSKYIGKRVDDLDKDIQEMFAPDSSRWQIFTETFINRDGLDEDMISGAVTFIDTTSGLITLARSNVQNFNSGLNMALTENCNGFPGDTHQASAAGGSIVYSGELEPHTDLSAILDSNKDSWFEYEGIKVDKTDYAKTNGYGFEYKEGISWLMTDGKLILELTITANIERLMNWITIDPFLPTERAFIPAKIISVKVDDGKGLNKEICTTPKDFRNETIFVFEKQYVKTITIRLEQPQAYYTEIGHQYFTEIGMDNNYLEPVSAEGDRVDGPKPSVELLGIRYEPATGNFKQPSMDTVYVAPNTKKLFLPVTSDTSALSGSELIRGNRYQIGIRGIELACIEFNTDSQFISMPYEFDEEITKVILEVKDYKPDAFGDGKWINYSISLDDCMTWIEVKPNDVYTLINPKKSIRVGITITRPIGNKTQYQTPIVYQYTLKGRKGTTV